MSIYAQRRGIEGEAVKTYPLVDELRARLVDEPSIEFEKTRLSRLREAVAAALSLPFYQRLYAGIDLHPLDIKSVSDLHQLPVFDVDHVRRSTDARPPFGEHQGSQDVARVQFSGGTTGTPRPVAYTYWDRVLGDVMHARCLAMHAVRSQDVVVNAMAYGPHNAAIAFDGALQRYVGATVLPLSTGLITPSAKQVSMMNAYGASHVIASADYLVHLAKVAQAEGYDLDVDFRLKGFTSIGDVAAAEQAWGVPAFSCYGTFELQMCATECGQRDGWHLWEDGYYGWVRDPSSGALVDDGQRGELIASSLWSRGFPVINMNTRDLTTMLPRSLCGCGFWLAKLGGFLGRSDSMIKVRGINVWPEAIGPALIDALGHPAEFVCVATQENGRDDLVVFVELEERLAETLGSRLKARLGIAVEVRTLADGTLGGVTRRDTASKTRRFLDRRPRSRLELELDQHGAPR